jgi:pathogenesis-related protein 1
MGKISLFFCMVMAACGAVSNGPVDTTPNEDVTSIEGRPPAILTLHNEARVRASANLPQLQWQEQLAKSAQDHANALARKNCVLEHSSTSFGENLFASSGASTGRRVVDAWESESKCYSFGRFPEICNLQNGCTACGHYTQLVWRETTSLGCGSARCGNGEVWVCHYNPAGNINGRTPY